MTLKLGLTLPQRGALFGATTPGQLLELATETDADERFNSIWVGDSLLAKPRPDSLTFLGGLATVTRRTTLGVGCMASFPVREPLVFAYQWATLDWLSQGRMLLAACTGLIRRGLSAAEGRQWDVEDRERASRMEDYVQLCRDLWSGRRVTRSGPGYAYEDVELAPTPLQAPCPIWIASNPPLNRADKPLRRVATIADGWMSAELRQGEFGRLWDLLHPMLTEASRDPIDFPTIAYHNMNINEDTDAGYAETKRFLDEYYGPVFSEDAVRAWTALGGPEECAQVLNRLHRDGAKEITVRLTSWEQKSQWDRLVREVVPLLDLSTH